MIQMLYEPRIALRVGLDAPHKVRLYAARVEYRDPITNLVVVDFDPMSATACSLEIRKPNKVEIVWLASLEGQSAAGVFLSHAIAEPSELDQEGEWAFVGKITTPIGVRETRAAVVPVLAKFRR
jgi:hypothetical protein